ncbi:MAG: ATP-binding protein [Desulfobulbus sp.]|nr:ATP-binding protein [Desulfobulbus sp.]
MRFSLHLGIRYRLFFAFFAAICCVIISMFVITRVSFERGAFRYIHAVEKERLQGLAQSLQNLYALNGSWGFLQEDATSWVVLVDGTEDLSSVDSRHHEDDHDKDKEAHRRENHHRRLGNLLEKHGPALDLDLPPPPPLRFRRDFEQRALLFDKDNLQLQGQTGPWKTDPYLLPLKVGGKTIGALGLVPPQILNDLRIRHFVSEQHQTLFLTALCIAAGAALLSLPLAGRMVRRIMTLAKATNRLASGEYAIRVPTGSGDELGQLARDFNQLAQTLESNEQLRRRWVADISHELRTPLAVLRGEVEAVQDGVRPLNAQTMDVLHGEILHLGRLVEDLYELSLADIGAMTYRKAELDWAQLVAQTVESSRKQFTAHQLGLDYTGPVSGVLLWGDSERLRQLLANLLQNTLRYTDAGGCLKVILVAGKTHHQLTFSDSVPGVPAISLARVFDRLYRVEGSRNRARGGAGLGLALCKSIVEAHGGRIQASASPLGGLQITIELPMNG